MRRAWRSAWGLLPERKQEQYAFIREWAGRAFWGITAGVSPLSYFGRYVLHRYRLRIRGVTVQSNNRPLAWALCRDIYEFREYDAPGFVAQPGWRVIDVGGNIGLFAMLAAARGARLVSYEPDPSLFGHLQSNTAKWGSVECRQGAVVSRADGPVKLFVHPERDIRNSLRPQSSQGEEMTTAIDVPAIALSEVLDRECDLLKIDIEGGEFDLFAAGGDTLRRAKRIIAEIHPVAGDPQQAATLLDEAGFDVDLEQGMANQISLTAVRRDRPATPVPQP